MRRRRILFPYMLLMTVVFCAAQEDINPVDGGIQWEEIEQEPSYDPNRYGFMFRPHASVGYVSEFRGDDKGPVYSTGGRFMMAAGSFQRWGLDVTYKHMEFQDPKDYLRLGIMLEQVIWKHFHMAIGTVGYLDVNDPENSPFGLCTGLGFEQHFDRFSFAVVYEGDILFNDGFSNANSLLLILGVGL